jgi:hypothetical protein
MTGSSFPARASSVRSRPYLQELCRAVVGRVEQSEQQMLGAYVLVSHPLRFVLSALQDLTQRVADDRLRRIRELRQTIEFVLRTIQHGPEVNSETPKDLWNESVRLFE